MDVKDEDRFLWTKIVKLLLPCDGRMEMAQFPIRKQHNQNVSQSVSQSFLSLWAVALNGTVSRRTWGILFAHLFICTCPSIFLSICIFSVRLFNRLSLCLSLWIPGRPCLLQRDRWASDGLKRVCEGIRKALKM